MPQRRWIQFGLRSFLIALTLLCVWVGIVAQRAAHQKRVIEFIRQRGGQVILQHHYDHRVALPARLATKDVVVTFTNGYLLNFDATPPGPAWIRQLVGDDFFQSVHAVHMRSCNDNDLAQLSTLRGVQHLHLGGVEITNQGMAYLSKTVSLQILDLTAILVTDDGIDELQSLTGLNELRLTTNASDDGIQRLRAALPKCRIETASLR